MPLLWKLNTIPATHQKKKKKANYKKWNAFSGILLFSIFFSRCLSYDQVVMWYPLLSSLQSNLWRNTTNECEILLHLASVQCSSRRDENMCRRLLGTTDANCLIVFFLLFSYTSTHLGFRFYYKTLRGWGGILFVFFHRHKFVNLGGLQLPAEESPLTCKKVYTKHRKLFKPPHSPFTLNKIHWPL